MKKKIPFSIIPAILLCGILPFIVRLHMEDIDLWEFSWFPNQSQWGDFFLYGKMQLFLVISVGAAIVLLDSFFVKNEKIPVTKSWLLLLAYGVLCLLSAFFSENKECSFHGGIEQYESVWVLLSYCVICCYGFYIGKKKENIEVLFIIISIVCILLGMIGISQLFHKDIFAVPFMKNVLIPDNLSEYRESVCFNFSEETNKSVYMTFYNPNYAGVFSGMMLPVLLGIFRATSKKWLQALAGIAMLLQGICLLGSGCKSALAAVIVVGAVFAIFLCIRDHRKCKTVVLGTVVVLGFWVVYDICVGNQSIVAFFQGFAMAEQDYGLEEIEVQEDKICINFKGETFFLWQESADGNMGLYLADESENLMPYKYDVKENACIPLSDKLEGVKLGCYEKEGIPYIFLEYKDVNWLFTNATEDGGYTYITLYGKTDKIEKADTVFSTSLDGMFTYRGYIWNRTIPLLKNYILVGSGEDSFLETFPQNDYVARAAAKKGFFTEIITRPHNMYLQTAVQTGVLSFVCLLGFVGTILIGAVKKIKISKKMQMLSQEVIMILSLAGAICIYLLAGITNDSTITVAPFFWLFLGIIARKTGREEI